MINRILFERVQHCLPPPPPPPPPPGPPPTPPPSPPPVESMEAGAEAPSKKAWSKPTIRNSDGVLLLVASGPHNSPSNPESASYTLMTS